MSRKWPRQTGKLAQKTNLFARIMPQPHLTKRGFSLLELLIAMSILVILASVALPAYSNYQVRAKATEFTLSVSPYKTILSEWALLNPSTNSWPPGADDLGWAEYQGDYVQQVSYRRATDASIAAIVVSGEIGEERIEVFYQGKLTSGRVAWICTARQASLQYLPKNCTSQVAIGL